MERGRAAPPQLTWPNIISTLLVVLALAGGAWTLLQSQRVSDKEFVLSQFQAFEQKEEVRHRDLLRREDEFRDQFKEMRNELLLRRKEFLNLDQFQAFEKRVDQYMQLPYLTKTEFQAWKDERDKIINQLTGRLERVEQRK